MPRNLLAGRTVPRALTGALAALVLTACTASGPVGQPGAEPQTTAAPSRPTAAAAAARTLGPPLTVAVADFTPRPRSFDPLSPRHADGAGLFTAGLLRPDPLGGWTGDLARAWRHSDQGRTWTFDLADARFSDGRPVTAEDVAFTLSYAVQHGLPGSEDISAVETLTQRRVRISTAGPSRTLVHFLAGTGVVPLQGWSSRWSEKPVGAGRWVRTGTSPGSSLVVEPNPTRPGAGFERITFVFTDPAGARAMVEQRRAQVAVLPRSRPPRPVAEGIAVWPGLDGDVAVDMCLDLASTISPRSRVRGWTFTRGLDWWRWRCNG